MEKLKVLDLFSGIGGFSLGLERTGGFETVAFCEIDPFCQKVLKKHWPDVPIYNDVRELDCDGLLPIDVVTGGYPCQPFSEAGKRRGAEDDRNLWPSMLAVLKRVRPTWILCENVAGHVSLGLDQTLSDLESEGYSARAFIIPACAVDAPHERKRVWIVAYAESKRCDHGDDGELQRQGAGEEHPFTGTSCPIDWMEKRRWENEPAVGRVAHGVPRRVDRLRALGNAVVPQIPEMIGHAILQAETRA